MTDLPRLATYDTYDPLGIGGDVPPTNEMMTRLFQASAESGDITLADTVCLECWLPGDECECAIEQRRAA